MLTFPVFLSVLQRGVRAPEVIRANRETPVNYLKGAKGCSSKKVARPPAQLKCLYASARSTGNKQEELEATELLERSGPVAITELAGMSPLTGARLPMATGCSEGTGEEEEAEALPSASRNG